MPHRLSPVLLAVCLACFLLAVPLQSAQGQALAPTASQAEVPLIMASDLRSLAKTKERFLLVDVRQPEEYAQGHIDHAILLPLDSLKDRYQELPKGKKIVVYCRSGKRSAQAVSFLRAQGYTHAVSLSGGYTEWLNAPM